MVYVSGLFGGVAAMLPVSIFAAIALWIFGALDLHSLGTQTFFACLTAGALGAFVSVLSRMASPKKFELDPEVGRRAIFYLGAYRPIVGAIFGLSLYFLLQSSLLQVEAHNEFATFVVAAFLGGFSERFVKVMLHSAESTVGGGAEPQRHCTSPRSESTGSGAPRVTRQLAPSHNERSHSWLPMYDVRHGRRRRCSPHRAT